MPAQLAAYTRETVVAEKAQAMVDLGLRNSRVKDYYDVWYLSRHFMFQSSLGHALRATFGPLFTPDWHLALGTWSPGGPWRR